MLHLISGLQMGGAEMMLLNLVKHTKSTIDHTVISFTNGPLAKSLAEQGVQVYILGMSAKIPNPLSLVTFIRKVKELNPGVIHAWMYHAMLMASIAMLLLGKTRLIWHVHHSDLLKGIDKRRTIIIAKYCARISKRAPERIVYCSKKGKDHHETLGYDPSKSLVIPNGFQKADLLDEKQEINAGIRIGIPDKARKVLHVGGFRPQKDHGNFMKAANIVTEVLPDAHFLLCGRAVSWENGVFLKRFSRFRNNTRIHVLGMVPDIRRLQMAADLMVVSSSHGEAFPLVLGEAMALGTPCVATDVGDAAEIIGPTGRIVRPRDPEALADAIVSMLTHSKADLARKGDMAQERVRSLFSMDEFVVQFLKVYGVAQEDQRVRPPDIEDPAVLAGQAK